MEATESRPKPPPVVSIQYLRAIAAMMVVFHHARNPQPWLYDPLATYMAGANGVDLFFVVSGFVMYTAARYETPLVFAWKRGTRIIPMYWIFTFLWIAMFWLINAFPISKSVVLKSLLFVPYRSWDGNIWPIFGPGWTLNYEIFFYAVFLIGLSTRRPIVISLTILAMLSVLGLIFHPSGAIGETYTNIRMLEFGAGLMTGWLFERKRLGYLYVVSPFALIFLFMANTHEFPFVVKVAIPAAIVVAGALGAEARGLVPRWRWAKTLGDASYSIYLSHLFVLIGCDAIWQRLPWHGELQFFSFMAASLLLSAIVGVGIHAYFEKPLTLVLQSRRPNRQRA